MPEEALSGKGRNKAKISSTLNYCKTERKRDRDY